MLKLAASLLFGFAFSTGALACQAPSADAPPAEVMILGTFHFTGGGADMINPEVDDFLSPRRQGEIAEVLDRLEAYAPTRILVELTPEHEAEFNAQYELWRADERDLAVNERQQIGMALAGRLGHDRLYAVDRPSSMDFDAMMAAAEAAGQTDLLARFSAASQQVGAFMAAHGDPSMSVLDRLIAHNSAQLLNFHDLYLLLAQMGSGENPAGAEEMALWWGRNLHIFANIARRAEPGERLLVIYGSGHKYLLDQFVQGAPNLQLVDPLNYLATGSAE